MSMQHRIFLVAPLGEAPHGPQRRHWEQRHGPLFAGLPGLRGYRQNRPLDREWERGRGWFCSETWFDDRSSEAASFATAFYRERVTPDEASFLDRDAAWQAVVLGEELPQPHPAPWRVLWFGDSPPDGPAWHGAELTRPAPGPDGVRRLYAAWFDTESAALAVTRAARQGVVAFACRPHLFVVGSTSTREDQP